MYSRVFPPQLSFFVSLLLFGLISFGIFPPSVAQAVSPNIVISQVYGGGGNSGAPYTHDFVELFNRGATPVSLAGGSIQYASATGTGNFGANSGQLTELPDVTLAPGQYYLIQQAGGTNGVPLPTADLVDPTPINMAAGAGKVALVTGATSLGCNGGSVPCSQEQLARIVDLVGYGSANFFEGSGAAPTLSNTTAAFRTANGCNDTDDNAADFSAGAPAPRNTSTPLNSCAVGEAAPQVTDVSPANGASDVALNATMTVTFSEAVNVIGNWFNIECAGNSQPATVSGGPQSFLLDPVSNLPDGESCTVTIFAANVTDQDSNDPPDNMAADYVWSFTTLASNVCDLAFTPIYAIQGSGMSAAITGAVTTQGVVVGDYEGLSPALRGFYLQDLDGDGDLTTSDGIFVFHGNNDSVNLGDVVRVTGSAGEFQDQTQLSNVSSIVHCGEGSVEPVDITLPIPSIHYLERYEGMLVRLPQTLYVTEHFQLGRFGQVILSSGDRLSQPTNVVDPGAPALALQAANDLNRIIVDDDLNNQNPDPIRFGRGGQPLSASNTLRGGDTATGIVGILTYTWAGNAASGNAYRVRPINALNGTVEFAAANPRPQTAPEVGGTLTVASFNVLNYFVTIDSGPDICGPAQNQDCRGAESSIEFERQRVKLLQALLKLDADVVGLIELENTTGVEPLADIVDGLNDLLGAGVYDYINSGVIGTDAIKVGLIYKPGAVAPVGSFQILDSSVDPIFIDTKNRPVLAQTFAENTSGEKFTVAVNHLKSKGSDCNDVGDPDLGDGQGNCNLTRTKAAQALVNWLATDPTGSGDPDFLIIGDLNAYAKEDPITAIRNAGYADLVERFGGADAYGYVFNGQWGYLDHALASPLLSEQVTGASKYHINADEPNVLDYNTNFKSAGQVGSLYAPDEFRTSDHDPVVVGFCLRGTPPQLSVMVTPSLLWPPNHKYVTVTATASSSDPEATVSLVGVTSNEPDNGLGDGDTPNDIVIRSSTSFDLRAERAGNGSGRIYTITYEAVDTCGDRAEVSATVIVPLNKGRADDTQDEERKGQDISQSHRLFLPSVSQ